MRTISIDEGTGSFHPKPKYTYIFSVNGHETFLANKPSKLEQKTCQLVLTDAISQDGVHLFFDWIHDCYHNVKPGNGTSFSLKKRDPVGTTISIHEFKSVSLIEFDSEYMNLDISQPKMFLTFNFESYNLLC
jgi:hypothetical protein